MDDQRLSAVIDVAIKKEEEAYAFYMQLCNLVEDRDAKGTLEFLAQEEKKHKEYLTSCGEGRYCSYVLNLGEIVDYKIIEHLEKPDIKKDMNSAEIYLVAAKREIDSYHFYKGMADSYPPGDMKDLLIKVANEEMKHKEKVEYLYANTAFPQTAGG